MQPRIYRLECLGQLAHRGLRGQVGNQQIDRIVAADFDDLIARGLPLRGIAAVQDHCGALLGKAQGRGLANTGIRACHQAHLAAQIGRVGHLSNCSFQGLCHLIQLRIRVKPIIANQLH